MMMKMMNMMIIMIIIFKMYTRMLKMYTFNITSTACLINVIMIVIMLMRHRAVEVMLKVLFSNIMNNLHVSLGF